MSLVSEALRKARAEAAARGERERGVVVRPTLIYRPGGSGSGPAVALAVAVVVAAALAGAALTWWLLSDRHPNTSEHGASRPIAARGAPGAKTPATSSRPAPTGGPETRPRAAPAAPPVVASPGDRHGASTEQSAPAPASFVIAAASQAVLPATSMPVASKPAARVEPSPSAQPAAPPAAAEPSAEAPARERTFVLDADLGSAKLHLDWLVYKPGAPFGRINGQDVVVGSTVDGFLVEEITADFVRLRGQRDLIILRAH